MKTYREFFFGGDITTCVYPHRLFHFLSQILDIPPPPYHSDVIFEWPLKVTFIKKREFLKMYFLTHNLRVCSFPGKAVLRS